LHKKVCKLCNLEETFEVRIKQSKGYILIKKRF